MTNEEYRLAGQLYGKIQCLMGRRTGSLLMECCLKYNQVAYMFQCSRCTITLACIVGYAEIERDDDKRLESLAKETADTLIRQQGYQERRREHP